MCPGAVSQTEAYETIQAADYQVVGWYHSHPAFAANPSVRDIETQSEFQVRPVHMKAGLDRGR